MIQDLFVTCKCRQYLCLRVTSKSWSTCIDRCTGTCKFLPFSCATWMPCNFFVCHPILTIKGANESWECYLSNGAWIVTVLIVLDAKNCSFLKHAIFLSVAIATSNSHLHRRTITHLNFQEVTFWMMHDCYWGT